MRVRAEVIILVVGRPTTTALKASFSHRSISRGLLTTCTNPFAPSSRLKRQQRQSLSGATSLAFSSLVTLRGGGADELLVGESIAWVASLATPSALVAGGVLSTLSDSSSMTEAKGDKRWVLIAKRSARLLLYTSFGFELVCLFSSVLTTTMLLSKGHSAAAKWAITHDGSTTLFGMEFLLSSFEFETLTSILSFLQGLINWIAGIALKELIPQDDDTPTLRRMNRLIASYLFTTVIFLIAIVNEKAAHYGNYFNMIKRMVVLMWQNFFHKWPPKLLALLAGPATLLSIVLTVDVFRPRHELEQDS